MKHYPLNINLGVYGTPNKPHPFSHTTEITHNPHSVYVCNNCGYVEFSTKYCEKLDI